MLDRLFYKKAVVDKQTKVLPHPDPASLPTGTDSVYFNTDHVYKVAVAGSGTAWRFTLFMVNEGAVVSRIYPTQAEALKAAQVWIDAIGG